MASSLIFSDRIPTSDLCNYYSPYFIYLFICLVLLTELLWSNYQDTRHFGENNQQIVSIGARTQSFSHDLQPPLGLTHDMSSLSLCVIHSASIPSRHPPLQGPTLDPLLLSQGVTVPTSRDSREHRGHVFSVSCFSHQDIYLHSPLCLPRLLSVQWITGTFF